MRAYKLRRLHGLSENQRSARVKKCRALLERAVGDAHMRMLFTDKKLFTIEQVYDPQNDRLYAGNSREAEAAGRTVSRSLHPALVMVFARVSATGQTPVFVGKAVRIDKKIYLGILRNHLLRWATEHYKNGYWILQQDGAPAHRAKSTQDWCLANLPDFISASEWPTNSPDLNVLDFSIWAMLEQKACQKKNTLVFRL
ncbi:hypothetical protein Y032_0473g2095 [Ancylostoma ceylanicum]|uniref:Tc1-like transposase DDE domain-containing protein n=1 Tax=Ancylostoma ceylanicum TaxID=53326 RepID=A0A016WYI6_9BILA|nr:hypothetical protein Y032_0473g2095 [Ancylostoma ceylanicum]